MAPSERVDPLEVIERAYAVDLPDHKWLTGLLERTAPAVDAGKGVFAYLYDVAHHPMRIWNLIGQFEPSRSELLGVIKGAGPEFVERTYLTIPFGTSSGLPGFERHCSLEPLRKYGIQDALGLNAFDPSGFGVWIGGFLPEKRTIEKAESERWAKVSTHIASAFRLRRRLERSTGERSPDRILSPDEEPEHTTGADVRSERAKLYEAVRRLEKARGRARKSERGAATALDAWRGLRKARWSLLDQFDSDGRRYVLAYRNVSASPDVGPHMFTDREREIVDQTLLGRSPKHIAYDMGLAPSTVRVHLANASRKFNVHTRDELIAKYRDYVFRGER